MTKKFLLLICLTLFSTQVGIARVTNIIEINQEDFCKAEVKEFDLKSKTLLTIREKLIDEKTCLHITRYDIEGNIVNSLSVFCKEQNSITDINYKLFFTSPNYYVQLSFRDLNPEDNTVSKIHNHIFELSQNDSLIETIETNLDIKDIRKADNSDNSKQYLALVKSKKLSNEINRLISFNKLRDLRNPNMIKDLGKGNWTLLYSFKDHAVMNKQCRLKVINILTKKVVSSDEDRFNQCPYSPNNDYQIKKVRNNFSNDLNGPYYNAYRFDSEQDFLDEYMGSYVVYKRYGSYGKIIRTAINSSYPLQYFSTAGIAFSTLYRYTTDIDFEDITQIFPIGHSNSIIGYIDNFSAIENNTIIILHNKLTETDHFSFLNTPPENALVFSQYCTF